MTPEKRAAKELEEEFKSETGKEPKLIVTDGVHVVGIRVYSDKYIHWLESLALRQRVELNKLNEKR